MKKIRTYAKSVGFDVIGKLRYMGKWDRNSRWFMDNEQNIYLLNDVTQGISIMPKKKPADNSADLI